MSVIGLIPARGGSKGIPGKNLVELGGRPLIAWTIEAAVASGDLTRVVVTTEDAQIAAVATELGAEVPFVRPAELAADDTPALNVVAHAIEAMRDMGHIVETIVYLQPTSPFRSAEDIVESIRMHSERKRSVVSVCPAKHHPSWFFRLSKSGDLAPYLRESEVADRRQDSVPLYEPNGAIYIASAAALSAGRTFFDGALGYVMPRERSLDLDEPFDLTVARLVAKDVDPERT